MIENYRKNSNSNESLESRMKESFRTNYEEIIMKTANYFFDSSKSSFSKRKFFTVVFKIFSRDYFPINSMNSDIFSIILKRNLVELIDKVKVKYKDLLIERIKKIPADAKLESFEWYKTKGTLPKYICDFIKKKMLFGKRNHSFTINMLPNIFIKKGIIKLKIKIFDNEIIASGIRLVNPQKVKITTQIYICPECKKKKKIKSKIGMITHLKEKHKIILKYEDFDKIKNMFSA